jgi:hypothetical protein
MKKKNAVREAAKALGMLTFSMNVPCRSGHWSERYVSTGKCVECVRTLGKARDRANNRARARSYYSENSEDRRAYRKNYYSENRVDILKWHEGYRVANRSQLSANAREFYAKNAEVLRKDAARRRAERSKRVVDWGVETEYLTQERLAELFIMAKILEGRTGVRYAVDHMLPLRAKLVCGLHIWNNLQVIPESLNQAKKNKMVLTEIGEWMLAIGCKAMIKSSKEALEAEKFYRDLGWDFKQMRYVSGPYFAGEHS